MNKTDKTTLFKSSLLAVLMGATFAAQAAGLGRLTVYSAIGQPLKAEVAVSATPEELGGISARLASHKEFGDAGIEFMSVLAGLRFDIDKAADGQSVLRLTTAAPVNEPFLHFLLELSWPSGRVVREYTFLLDPPEMLQAAKPAAVVVPAAPQVRSEAPPAPAPAVRAATPAPMAPVAPAASRVSAAPAEIVVKPGDTLSKIAREHKVDAVSLDQMLVALFNSNREVFDDGNMNRLRAGRILRLPDPADAAMVEAGEARKLIVSQAADFNAYRRRLASAASALPAPEATARREAAGKIVAEVEPAPAPAVAKDKLEVSRTEVTKAASAEAAKRGLEEDLIARDKALREAAERIAQLEKNIENLKGLVEIKSQAGAEMQQQASAAAAPAVPAPVPQAEPAPAAPVAPSPAAKPDAPVDTAPVAAAETKPTEVAPPQAKPAPKPPAKRPAAPPPPPPPEPSFIEENPALVFGGAGVLALLLGYLGFSAWRRKKKARDENEFAETPSMAEAGIAGAAAAGVAVDSFENSEVSIQGDFSEGGVLTTEERVDPVAEADVLMAYGRDGQAEEILKEGLKDDPARTAIHLKLLELYANRKDGEKFDEVAESLREQTQEQGAEWESAAALARDHGLASTLFPAESVEAPPAAPEESMEEAPAPHDFAATAAETAVLDAPPLETPTADEVAAVAADAGLDFDLDLGTTSGAPAPVEEPPKPAADEVMSLDFDFDLGTPEPQAPAVAAETPEQVSAPDVESVAEPAAAADDGSIDFSLDIEAEAPVEAVAEELSLPASGQPADEEVALAGGIDFNLDSGEEAEAAPAVEDEGDREAAKRGLSEEIEVDFDLELDAPVAAAPPVDDSAAPQLPDISLDLDVAEVPAEVESLPAIAAVEDVPVEPAPAPAEVPEPADDLPDDPEVATKLELAQAYEEMGDREGARELLNEVLAEGSAAQRALAQARLEQLA